jgi:hypothetical protein
MQMMVRSSVRCISLKQVILTLGAFLFFASIAKAQAPTTIFQLDGNAAPDGSGSCIYSGPCDTWNLLNGTGGAGPIGTGSSAGHSGVRVFINGTSSTDSFTGGGSKDFYPLSKWAYSSSPTPNKDTLNAGYAAAYSVSDFDIIFGANRASPNGDANIGIWFFQQTVGLDGKGGFTGAHVNGDVFIISAFTGGGGTSTITAYVWNSSCTSGVKNPAVKQCADANLELLANPTTVCTSSSPYCAITNSTATASTWGGSLVSPLFFEGGIDITQAFAGIGQTVPCFASFLEETRSSQSTSAVLKDFLLGGFPVCSMAITKTCGTSSINPAGTGFVYPVNGVVTNTGIGSLSNVQVKDCINGTFSTVAGVTTCSGTSSTISVSNNTTGSGNFGTNSLGANETGTWSDSSSSTSVSQSDQAFAIAATTSGGAQTLQSANTASQTCMAQANSTLTVTKSCSTTLQNGANGTAVSVLVSYGGMVCNTGAAKVTGVALTDYPDSIAITSGTNGTSVQSGITLGPKGSTNPPDCVSYTGSYTPTLLDETINSGAGAGRYFFDDLVTISSATAAVGTLTQFENTTQTPVPPLVYNPDSRINATYGFASARCPICQGSSECTTP